MEAPSPAWLAAVEHGRRRISQVVVEFGGLIKGVGRIVLREGTAGAKVAEDILRVLNNVGRGNAAQWIRKLNLPKYAEPLLQQFRKVTTALRAAFQKLKALLTLSEGMQKNIDRFLKGLDAIEKLAAEMIPTAIKSLWKKLQEIQKVIQDGSWVGAPVGAKVLARTFERKLVAGAVPAYEMKAMQFPGLSSPAMLQEAKGWPIFKGHVRPTPEEIAGGCHTIPEPVWLPPGTELVRVIETSRSARGTWWILKKDLPSTGPAWRTDFAVLEDWNKNGYKIEIVVPDTGAWVWESVVASQLQTDLSKVAAGQYLVGGAKQIYLDLDFLANAEVDRVVRATALQPTNWTGLHDVGMYTDPATGVMLPEIPFKEIARKPGMIEQLPKKVGKPAAAAVPFFVILPNADQQGAAIHDPQ